ncbi:unnamed protein product [Acanthoscelides obtectus]|uniref:Uncharacterized protein n=1 Tax=Acanthoscelides obtectus TaxID=200917 RepID=A0A9P0KQK9_ACAOB|nr:unnamed protein product [Acanthoscelides obtectus]CAK1633087.1 hypothetical protein AOBTE_LOCUS7940 [Acanthoscelides obtectus]
MTLIFTNRVIWLYVFLKRQFTTILVNVKSSFSCVNATCISSKISWQIGTV